MPGHSVPRNYSQAVFLTKAYFELVMMEKKSLWCVRELEFESVLNGIVLKLKSNIAWNKITDLS